MGVRKIEKEEQLTIEKEETKHQKSQVLGNNMFYNIPECCVDKKPYKRFNNIKCRYHLP